MSTFSLIVDTVTNPQFVFTILVAIAAFATAITVAAPYFGGKKLSTRMKAVAIERDRMRAERLAELAAERGGLRKKPMGLMKQVVEQLNLRRIMENDDMKAKLRMAGLRGQAPVIAFMFFRLVAPIATFFGALLYLFVVAPFDIPAMAKLAIALGAGLLGVYLPNLFIQNIIQRRQQSIKRAFPDALDLLLICVQSGMSVEAAFAKVAKEIGPQSIELAEELSLTTAELSYLPERRQAYENLAKRTGLPGVKAVCTSLIQAERYGTPVSHALRVLAQENRDMRMAEAEKKAAALPPKLTVPMIVFFLPVLFVVIMGPAIMKVMTIM